MVVAAAATMVVTPLALMSGGGSSIAQADAAQNKGGNPGATASSGSKARAQALRNIQSVDDRIVAPTTTTTVAPAAAPTTTAAPVVVTTTTAPHVYVAPTTTTVPAPVLLNSESGQATWYNWNPGQCASPTLPHGTEVTVTNLATGASVSCLITDTETSGWPRVIDMDPSVFDVIAGPEGTSAGVLNVSVSW